MQAAETLGYLAAPGRTYADTVRGLRHRVSILDEEEAVT